jgi:exopolysaccharide production protein ExoQ
MVKHEDYQSGRVASDSNAKAVFASNPAMTSTSNNSADRIAMAHHLDLGYSADRGKSVRPLQFPGLYLFYSIGLLFVIGGFGLQLSGADLQATARPEDASALSQVVNGSILVLAFIAFVRSPYMPGVLTRAWPILLLPMLAIISSFWAEADTSVVLRRSAAFSGSILFGLSLATRFSMTECVKLIITSLSLAIFLSFVWVFIFPIYGVNQVADASVADSQSGLWRGIFAHKNVLGPISGLTFALLLVYGSLVFRRRILRLGALALSCACTIAAGSGSGFTVAAIMPFSFYLLSSIGRFEVRRRVSITFFLLMCFTLIVSFLDDIESVVLWLVNRQADFTGREPYWYYITQLIDQDHMLFGYGYSAFGFSLAPKISSLTGVLNVNAHNGYLEILIAFGYVGSTVIAFVFIWLVWQSYKILLLAPRNNAAVYAFPLGLLVFAALTNVVESTFLNNYHLMGVIWGLVPGMFAREALDRRTFASRPIQNQNAAR